MMNPIKAFLKDEEGAETLEYVVMVAAIVGPAGAAYGQGVPTLLQNSFVPLLNILNRCIGG